MALTPDDLVVIHRFLERSTCHGAQEANSLLVLMQRVEEAHRELTAPPPPQDE